MDDIDRAFVMLTAKLGEISSDVKDIRLMLVGNGGGSIGLCEQTRRNRTAIDGLVGDLASERAQQGHSWRIVAIALAVLGVLLLYHLSGGDLAQTFPLILKVLAGI